MERGRGVRRKVKEEASVRFTLRIDKSIEDDLAILYNNDKRSFCDSYLSRNQWLCGIFESYVFSRKEEIDSFRIRSHEFMYGSNKVKDDI